MVNPHPNPHFILFYDECLELMLSDESKSKLFFNFTS